MIFIHDIVGREITQRHFGKCATQVEAIKRGHSVDDRHPVTNNLAKNSKSAILSVQILAVIGQIDKPLVSGAVWVVTNFRHGDGAAHVGEQRFIDYRGIAWNFYGWQLPIIFKTT